MDNGPRIESWRTIAVALAQKETCPLDTYLCSCLYKNSSKKSS